MASGSRKQCFLICPEFLPALARLLARDGLPLSALAQELDVDFFCGTDDGCIFAQSGAVRKALRSALESANVAESYVAESLLQPSAQERLRDEPPIAIHLASAPTGSFQQLLVPGAVILGVDSRYLRQGPGGVKMLDSLHLTHAQEPLTSNEAVGHENVPCETIDVVIREVACRTESGAGNGFASEPCRWQCVLRVEVLSPPDVSVSGEQAADCAECWADLLCSRCASAVFISPVFQHALSSLLVDMQAELVHLSARSGSSRGVLSARLVRRARKLQQDHLVSNASAENAPAEVSLCLAASSGSSPIVLRIQDSSIVGDDMASSTNQRLLLLQGRDAVPAGALVAGVTVDRMLGHGVSLSLGGSSMCVLDVRRDYPSLILTRRRLPRGKVPVTLPSVGTTLACLLVQRSSSEPGPAEELVPSLIDSACVELEDLLGRQFGLKTASVSVPDSRVDRARACRVLLEACGTSLRVEFDMISSQVRITGVPEETDRAIEFARSLRGNSLEISDRAAWRIIGKGGSGIRQLEQDSGGAWIRVNTEDKPHTLEIFGEVSAVQRVETLIRTRHSNVTMEVNKKHVSRIIGRGGVTKREIETTSGGVSLHIDADLEPCIVEVLGEAAAVDRAVALINEHLTADRLEVPRRVVPYIIGKKGCNLKELEAVSSAFLNVSTESEPCIVEISGSRSCKDKAHQLLKRLMDQHAYDNLKVSRDISLYVIGRRGAVLRDIEATTGASLRADSNHDPCTIEVFGDKVSVHAAIDLLRGRASPCRSRVSIPRYTLPYVLGRAGIGTQEIESSTGALLHVDMRDSANDEEQQCVVEILGRKEQVEKAEELFKGRLQRDMVDVSASAVPRIIGRGGSTIRTIQASTGAMLHIPDKHGDTCRIEIFGAEGARTSARTRIEELAFGPTASTRSAAVQHSGDSQVGAIPSAPAVIEFSPLSEPIQETPRASAVEELHAAAEPLRLNEVASEVDGTTSPQCRDRLPGSVLAGLQIPDELILKRSSSVPWAWRMPVSLDSPRKVSADEAKLEIAPEHVSSTSSMLAVVPSNSELRSESQCGSIKSRQLLRRLSRLSRGLAKRQKLIRASERRLSHGSAASCSSDSASIGVEASAPSLCDLLRTDLAMDICSENLGDATADFERIDFPCLSPERATAAVEEESRARATEDAIQLEDSSSTLARNDAPRQCAQIESLCNDWAAKVPTPLREAKGKRLHSEAEATGSVPVMLRSLRQRVEASMSMSVAAPKSPSLFILDGLNIMRSRNTPLWNSWDTRAPQLEWIQLEQACRYYTSRGQKVSVYLPPLRLGHEEQLEKCRQEFGDIFVSCCSASDDLFMINTVKLYEDAHRAQQDSACAPLCRIVTNDRFEDWKRRGDMDSAWIERHCVRFAFGPGGFVPSELV